MVDLSFPGFFMSERGGKMFGISNEWWILYVILAVFGVAKLYWTTGLMKSYDQFFALLTETKEELREIKGELRMRN